MPKQAVFKVAFEMEVSASTPQIAAMVARDMLFDPTRDCVNAQVYPTEFVEGPDDWLPVADRGWEIQFEVADPVAPVRCIAWETLAWEKP